MPQVDYGIDHPRVVIATLLLALTASACSLLWSLLSYLAALLFLTTLYLYATSRLGKPLIQKAVVREAGLRGEELVLDVGTGRGLLAIGLAKRLVGGHAYGVDVWSGSLSGNLPSNALRNAEVEGVDERVTFDFGDATDLPFPDDHFDLVVSNMLLHVLSSRERMEAVREMCRVLKPGGRLIVSDLFIRRQVDVMRMASYGVEPVSFRRPGVVASLLYLGAVGLLVGGKVGGG